MEFVHLELKRDTWMKPTVKIHSPHDAIIFISNMIENMSKEVLIAINLATDGTVINSSIVSVGTVNQSMIFVADIIRTAILSGGATLILLHNHPSGNIKPSNEDQEITKKIVVACNLMGLELLDHIIVGANGNFYSFKEEEEQCFYVNKHDYEKLMIAEGVRKIDE